MRRPLRPVNLGNPQKIPTPFRDAASVSKNLFDCHFLWIGEENHISEASGRQRSHQMLEVPMSGGVVTGHGIGDLYRSTGVDRNAKIVVRASFFQSLRCVAIISRKRKIRPITEASFNQIGNYLLNAISARLVHKDESSTHFVPGLL